MITNGLVVVMAVHLANNASREGQFFFESQYFSAPLRTPFLLTYAEVIEARVCSSGTLSLRGSRVMEVPCVEELGNSHEHKIGSTESHIDARDGHENAQR